MNLVSDSPLILVWVSIYYLWHYIELGTKTEFQKIKLESLVKEMELKTALFCTNSKSITELNLTKIEGNL